MDGLIGEREESDFYLIIYYCIFYLIQFKFIYLLIYSFIHLTMSLTVFYNGYISIINIFI